jgi:hypothetical protein
LKFVKIIKERRATLLITPEIEISDKNEVLYRGLFLAGDLDSNPSFPATIEGAAQSGVESSQND